MALEIWHWVSILRSTLVLVCWCPVCPNHKKKPTTRNNRVKRTNWDPEESRNLSAKCLGGCGTRSVGFGGGGSRPQAFLGLCRKRSTWPVAKPFDGGFLEWARQCILRDLVFLSTCHNKRMHFSEQCLILAKKIWVVNCFCNLFRNILGFHHLAPKKNTRTEKPEHCIHQQHKDNENWILYIWFHSKKPRYSVPISNIIQNNKNRFVLIRRKTRVGANRDAMLRGESLELLIRHLNAWDETHRWHLTAQPMDPGGVYSVWWAGVDEQKPNFAEGGPLPSQHICRLEDKRGTLFPTWNISRIELNGKCQWNFEKYPLGNSRDGWVEFGSYFEFVNRRDA